MGIRDLHKVLSSLERNCSIKTFQHLNIGIDGHGWLYRSAARTVKLYYEQNEPNSIGGANDTSLEELVIQKALKFFVAEIKKMLDQNINKVILVLDGDKIPIKMFSSSTKNKNNYNKHRIKITRYMCVTISRHLEREFADNARVEVINAPYEADAQLGYLYKTKKIDVAISEDYDLLCYGCKHIFSKYSRGGDGVLIDARYLYACDWKPNKNFGKWTEEMFLTFCILCGCDYLARLPLVGPVKAFDSVNTYKTIESILKCWEEDGSIENIPESYLNDFRRSYLTFLYAIVVDNTGARVHLNKVQPNDAKYIGDYLGVLEDRTRQSAFGI